MGLIGTAANSWNSEGAIMMHDQNGPPNNKTVVATIPTRADHGNSEDGVLGFRLQPGFDLSDPSKRNVFVYYSPRPGPGDDWPMTSTPARQTLGYNQISRFTLTADGKSAVPGSERVIIRVPKNKIGGSPSGFPGGPTDSGPGHVGGAGLEFDSAGNMYLGIGDDVSPNAPGHSGYTPMDYRAQERWDARKTSANTADLRGKIIRITPKQGDIAADAAPGVGSTYDIPSGNLFPVGTPKTRPEIYGMGFRQPFTIHADPKNPGIIGMGEYCHDASSNRDDRSPAGICEWNLVTKAGNFGWPFCMGNQSPENTNFKWDYANNKSTGERYDCSQDQIPSDINYAPAGQTPVPATFQGLDMIPKPTPATIWKKYPNAPNGQSTADYGDLSAGGMQPISGPIYRYPSTAASGAFPRYYDGAWFINNRGSTNGFWKEVRMRRDNNEMLRVQDWLPYNSGATTATQSSLVIGTQFGADGALYMARYPVTCCRNNTSASSQVQIVKISFNVYDETTAPTTSASIDPATPGEGRTYNGPVTVNFSATDPANEGGDGPVSGIDYIESRVITNGAPSDWVKATDPGINNPFTASTTVTEQGQHVVEYRAVDKAGNVSATKQVPFYIAVPTTADTDVKANVKSVLKLTLGAAVKFDPGFDPGTAKQYTASTTVTATSSWPGGAKLTAFDPSTTNTGRMVNAGNGGAVLASPLELNGGGTTFSALGGSAAPTTLKTYAGPISSDQVTVNFRQSIAATEPLTAGDYTKTVTFSLAATTP
jgi:hypothetical protein